MLSMDDSKFMSDMNNLIQYAEGFLDGAQAGKAQLLKNLGEDIADRLGDFIDSNARVDPASLSHVYEWNQTGVRGARLFEINSSVRTNTITITANMLQSRSIKPGSNTPFSNKATVMEQGKPVTISPRMASKLVFEVDGKTVFTKKSVTVEHPGGIAAQGGFEKAFDSFFTVYLSQAVLYSMGLQERLSKPEIFKRNLKQAKTGGRSLGFSTGIRWVSEETR
jgi:hypothetical protein